MHADLLNDLHSPKMCPLSYTTLFRSPRRRDTPTRWPPAFPSSPLSRSSSESTSSPTRWPARHRATAIRCTRSGRSEEHTSELQSRGHLVCRLLLEKKKRPKCRTNGHT